MNHRRILSGCIAAMAMVSCDDSRISAKPVVDETTNGFQARLLLPDGSPAAFARVKIASSWRLAGDTDGTSMVLACDADGRVGIPALPTGEYWLEAAGPTDGIRLPLRTRTGSRDTSWQLLPLATVRGSTTPFARIRAYGSDRSWSADAQGRFELDALPPGRLNLRSESQQSDSVATEASVVTTGTSADTTTFSVTSLPDASTWKHVWTQIVPPDPASTEDTLKGFRIPVRIDFRFFLEGLRTPNDLRILTSRNESVPFDVESWDEPGRSAVVWARLPTAHPRRGDTLDLVWGKSGLAPRQNASEPKSVYGIWHLGGSDPLADATGNSQAIRSDIGTRDTSGVVGQARALDSASQSRIIPPSYLSMDTGFTISCWARLDGRQVNHAKIFDLGETGPPFGTVMIDIDSATARPALQLAFADGTWKRVVARQNPSGWFHLGATWNGKDRVARFFVDGMLQDTIAASVALTTFTGHDLVLGNQETGSNGIFGGIDEFRLDLAVHSGGWIRHQWFSQRPENSSLTRLR